MSDVLAVDQAYLDRSTPLLAAQLRIAVAAVREAFPMLNENSEQFAILASGAVQALATNVAGWKLKN